ncbi:MAG: SpoIIE family protein phosphatase [Aliishimia sp.]
MLKAQNIEDNELPQKNAGSRKVLVVDDSRLMRKILSSSLKKWGYDVSVAESAEQAMELSAEIMPEIVVSDWMMPGMSGPEFCRAFRDLPSNQYTYFILLTSKSDKSEIALGLEAGADDFLTKPPDNHELRARIRAGERILDMQTHLKEKNRELGDALREVERLNDALDHDLREARQLQQSLLPERHSSFGACDVSVLLQSSGYVGGDLVGFYPVGKDHLGMYAIDVSGHGISAALMTARLAGFLSSVAPDQNVAMRKTEDGDYRPIPPAQAIENLNNLVLDEMETEHYFTMLLGDLNLRTGLLTLGQAGHPHPLLQRANGEMTQESPGGFPVGLMYGAGFSQFEVQLNPGDRILFHSDGFTECPNLEGDMMGEAGLEEIIEKIGDLQGTSFIEALVWHLGEFAGGSKFPDDVSAVLLQYNGA